MAFNHGKVAVFKVQSAAGTLTDISQYLNTDGLSRSADTADVTTFGKNSHVYIPGLKDGTISFEGSYDPTVDALLDGILAMERNWEYFPAGTTAGQPKYSGAGILMSYDSDSDVTDAGRISGEFQLTGDVTRGVAP